MNQELDTTVPPIVLDPRHYHGSFRQGKDEKDSNCWASPSGAAFMIRGKTYLKDNTKVGICLNQNCCTYLISVQRSGFRNLYSLLRSIKSVFSSYFLLSLKIHMFRYNPRIPPFSVIPFSL